MEHVKIPQSMIKALTNMALITAVITVEENNIVEQITSVWKRAIDNFQSCLSHVSLNFILFGQYFYTNLNFQLALVKYLVECVISCAMVTRFFNSSDIFLTKHIYV